MKPASLILFAVLFFRTLSAQDFYKVVNQSGHSNQVLDCEFSPDGHWLLSIGQDNKLLRWDLHTSRHFAPIQGLSDLPDRIFFLNDEDYLITTKKYTTYKGNVNNPNVIEYEKARFPMARSELCFNNWVPFIAFRSFQTKDPKLMFYYPDHQVGDKFYQCNSAETVVEGQIETMFFEEERKILFLGDDKGNVYAMPTSTRVIQKILNVKGNKVKNITASKNALLFTVENDDLKSRSSLYFCKLHPSDIAIEKKNKLSGEINPVFLTYHKKDNQFILGNTLLDSFYTVMRRFSDPNEFKDAAILWRGKRNSPVRSVDVLDKANQMAIFTFEQNNFIWDLEMNKPAQKLGNLVNNISNFSWNPDKNIMHLYSEKDGHYTSINLNSATSSYFKVPFKANSSNFILQNGNLLIHNSTRSKLHLYSYDGKSDSIDMPFSEFWDFIASKKHNRVVGFDRKNMVLLNADDLTKVSSTPANLGIMSGEFKMTPDEHFYYWKNLNFGKDDTIFLHSTITGEFVGHYIYENLVDEDFGVERTFTFVDSGRYRLVNSSKLDTAMMYHYSLILSDNDEQGAVRKVFSWPYQVDNFLPGRNSNEIMIVSKSLSTSSLTYHILNLKTMEIDSLPMKSIIGMGQIQWIDNDRFWVLTDVNDIAIFGHSGNLKLLSLSGKSNEYSFSTAGEGFALVSQNGDMICTKGSSNLISFDIETLAGTRILPGNILEPYFNKPHIVLKDLNSNDSNRIVAFEKAFDKRMRRIPVNGLTHQDSAPNAYVSLISGSLITDRFEQTLYMHYESDVDSVSSLHIEHNGNLRNGINGIKLESASKKGTYKFNIKLIPGVNRFTFSAEDKSKRRSIPQYVEIFLMDDYYFYTPQTYVIAIGVSKYKDSSNNLVFASKDSRDIVAWSKKQKNFTIDTFIDENALWNNIEKVKDKLRNIMPHDRVIISFSGHGLLDKNLDLYLALHETDFQNPSNGGIKLEKLVELLDSTPALHKLLLIDACHSGEIDKDGMVITEEQISPSEEGARGANVSVKVKKKQSVDAFEFMKANFEDAVRGNGTVVISAAGGKEYALENANYSNGIFTYALLQCLNNLHGDTNKDGKISLTELKNYVITTVPQMTNGRQQPTMRKEINEYNWIVR